MKTIFATGVPQTINDVLKNKDQRSELQQRLMTEFPTATIVAIKLNIPGPIKNNTEIKKIFETGTQVFLKGIEILKQVALDSPAGPELLLVTEQPAEATKKAAIEFEDAAPYRRLFDIDVLNQQHGHYSRTELGMPSRKCLICNENAKECARSRKHSVEELQTKISEIYAEEIDG